MGSSAPYFFATLVISSALTVFIFWATSDLSWWVRTPTRTLALAATFTPGIAAAGHGATPAPAILVVIWGLGGSVRYFINLGAVHIATVWAMVVCWIWAYATAKNSD